MRFVTGAFRRDPNLWRLADLIDSAKTCGRSFDGRAYMPARPEGFSSWRSSLRLAWLVFTGRADAVVWPEDLEQ